MAEELEKVVEETAVRLLKKAATILPDDVVESLDNAQKETKGSLGKSQFDAILENVDIAKTASKPMCQDTGLVAFFVKIGDQFPLRSKVKDILIEATKKATEEVPLRPNAVDMFEGNTGNNVGLRGFVPWFYFDLVEGDKLEIVAMPKGGGSSNIAKLKMLPPGKGWKGIVEFVIEAVTQAGALGCPPYTVGVGIGGGEDMCMNLAKMALLRPINDRQKNKQLAKYEELMLEKVNQLGIGVMGLGEGESVFDVHIEMAARHPASLPVGVVISCWAFRHKKAIINAKGEILKEE